MSATVLKYSMHKTTEQLHLSNKRS